MSNILLVKMSSMGDLVHCFPALSDAARQGHRFDWVVEEAFVDLAALHPAVDEVYPISLRRWRKTPTASLAEFAGFVRHLRQKRYDSALDAQGLIKSGVITRIANAADRLGLAANSAREPLGTKFYNKHFEIDRGQHAIDRLRLLFGAALSYQVDLSETQPIDLRAGALSPSAAPIEPPSERSTQRGLAQRPVILLQGTSWASKEYPVQGWCQLARELARRSDRELLLISSDASEHSRAREIAASVRTEVPQLQTPAPEPLMQVIDRIVGASLVVGVDSGLTHLAAVLGLPTIGLYGPTSAQLTGARGPLARNAASDFACAPCQKRECSYHGEPQTMVGQVVRPACFAQFAAGELLDSVADVWPAES